MLSRIFSTNDLNVLINEARTKDPLLSATAAAIKNTVSPGEHKVHGGAVLGRFAFASYLERFIKAGVTSPKNTQARAKLLEKHLFDKRRVEYEEKIGNSLRKHTLDFDTPQTAEAAKKVGVKYEDCVMKYIF